MSGTAYGSIVLHVTPEYGASGGPLAKVRDGNRIRLSVAHRRLELLVDEDELSRRRSALKAETPRAKRATRGYAQLFDQHILQADEGCDFDFLRLAR